jgi:hypothetical protein
MYRFLCRHLPRPLANVAIIIWYVLLVVLVVAGFSIPQAEFRYLNL